ncbi:DUF3291 domain-containing protein [Streptomyces sp. DH20]|uniref:DUF3291 domain-containing protein n=1 Tax=Streptomyces sp. DH20 TaxID=2857009 RepID=UPI0035AE84C1
MPPPHDSRPYVPLDTPLLKDFVDNLDPVNADADAADGFVWRLQSDDGDATAIPVFGDPWLIVNMSVWRDTDALTAFMYQGRHRETLSRRRVGVPPRLAPARPRPDPVRLHPAHLLPARRGRGQAGRGPVGDKSCVRD